MATLLSIDEIIELGDVSTYLSANYVSKAALFGGTVIKPTPPKLIALVTDGVRWGNEVDGVVVGVNATGAITITDIGNNGDEIEVFVNDPYYGVISLGSYEKQSSDTTATILAASITTELNNNSYGYSATSLVGVITITARSGLGSTINGGSNLSVTITPALVPSTDLYGWWISTEGVTDPTSITSWADQSGNGNDLVQATSNRQPRIISGFNGFDALGLKAGTNIQARLRRLDNDPIPAITEFTMFVVGSQTSNANGIDGNGTFVGVGDIVLQRYNNDNTIYTDIAGYTSNTTPVVNDTVYTFRLFSDGTDQIFALNNVVQDSQSGAVTFSQTPFTVFQNQSAANSGNKMIYEILFYTSALSPSEITQVEDYLQNKYQHY